MKLGFGLMRLPHKGIGIDIAQTSKMVDMFIESGGTYFDTAYVYLGSEEAARKALCTRHSRDTYTLATKLNASVALTEKIARGQLETSLKRTGAEYFDYYLLHSLMEKNFKKYDKFDLWNFAKEQKKAGLIRNYGFSFHGGPQLLDELLTEHNDVDFVQLQINYCDWESSKVKSRENYEVARKHNKQIVVMEPVKGGSLADPPANVKEIFKKADPNASYASWAIRYAASLDGILSVLSGMSNNEPMKDNLSFMKDFKPLTPDEYSVIKEAQRAFNEVKQIPCTACGYCKKGCPKQINIPAVFLARNEQLVFGLIEKGRKQYESVVSNSAKASECIRCGACEKVCPQKIQITEELASCAEVFEKNS
ncbi:MAG: aldo/keto reductase [Clostridia bacterium]|nr:aldo/keto reductase [Clostridia bacterium]